MIEQNPLPFKLQFSDDLITPHAGLILAHEFHLKSGLGGLLRRMGPQPGSNRGYKADQVILPLVLMLQGGGRRLSDLRALRNDPALRTAAGLGRLISADAVGDWLRRVGSDQAKLACLRRVQRQLVCKRLRADSRSSFTLDVDASVIKSEKGDGAKAYDGTIGYQPMFGIIAENGMLVHFEFRAGNVSPQSGGVEFISACETTLPAGKRIGLVRSDSAFFNREVTDYCFREGKRFIIAARWNSVVKGLYELLGPDDWTRRKDPETRKLYEVADMGYRFEGGLEAFRLIYKRELKSQQELFETGGGRIMVVATNIPQEQTGAWEATQEYNARGTMEQHIGEVKNGFGMCHMPCGQQEANAVWLWIGALAYNLFLMFREAALPASWARAQVETLRWRLYQTAGKLVRHAGALILKVACGREEFDVLWRIRGSPAPLLTD